MLSDSALISAAKSASSLRTLTPALGRSDEADTTVIDLSPRTLDRETARDMLIELFYASLPEAEIGRAINLLGVVMP